MPDTRPGIGPKDSVGTYGTVAEARAEGVKSVHIGRSGPWVPEERNFHLSFYFPTALFPLPVVCYRLIFIYL